MADFNDDEISSVTFDPADEVSYYYGHLNREDVKEILDEAPIGTFLIRDSIKDVDQKVLCVKEAPKTINNYKIIHKIKKQTQQATQQHVFNILGKEDLTFKSITEILEFYSTHYLNQSPLVRPAFAHKKVLTLYDFQENGDPNEDLYFKEGEILTVIEYTQGDEWWKASNKSGRVGLIPATLVRRLKPNECLNSQLINCGAGPVKQEIEIVNRNNINNENGCELAAAAAANNNDDDDEEESMKCPFKVKVVENYTPSPYEHSHIALRKGQIVTVLEMKSMGKWYGELNNESGKRGLFPFNRVEIIKDPADC